MGKRNNFLTFLSALIPGIGYMYLGLTRKGLQALLIFILVSPVAHILSLDFLGDIIKLVFWCYTFFDTFHVAHMIDKGEIVQDSDLIHTNLSLDNKNTIVVIGWVILALGILGLVNKLFYSSSIYYMVKHFLGDYIVPLLLITAGIYMLSRSKR